MTSGPARTRVRIARATGKLDQVVVFYRGLGFRIVGRFEEHAGYAGVILGLPGGTHLEFTQHDRATPTRVPDPDDLLVLYLPSAAMLARLRKQLERLGHACVRPANPYWLGRGVTFLDPDGWHVVLCHPAAN